MPFRAQHILPSVERALLAAFFALLALHTGPRAWRTLNTDFPNYYLAAQLAREGYDTSQAYDWRWFQRQKDHREIDQRVIGLAPITPFSTLFVLPFSNLAPLSAKHLWLVLQLALLLPITLSLASLTGEPLRRIWLLTLACLPLHRNLLYGQFYILLLGMLVAACWAYRRHLSAIAGTLVAVAAMTKIFPAVFLLYFLRKRDWRALSAAALSISVCGAISVYVFGWSMHRHYLQVVLPWTLRGEALPPYTLASSSISSLLHRLFILEPQENPHPWHNAPAAAAVLGPVLQTLLLAPAILLARRGSHIDDRSSTAIEWSAILSATLTVSTVPASYNFTLLILPMTVLCSSLLPGSSALALGAVLLYLGIGFPNWNTATVDGLQALLHVSRLYLLIALTLLCYQTLAGGSLRARIIQRSNLPWVGLFTTLVAAGVLAGLRHQRGLFSDYAYRLPMPAGALLSADPAFSPAGVESISLLQNGYRLTLTPASPAILPPSTPLPSTDQEITPTRDQLSFAHSPAGDWVEEAGSSSRILAPPSDAKLSSVENAHAPTLSPDRRTLVYVRDDHGRGKLFGRSLASPDQVDTPLTPPSMDVLEAAPLANGSVVVAALVGQAPSQMFLVVPSAAPAPMQLGEARYPSVSPDGRWLAYSRFQSGAWNLWLLNLRSNTALRLTEVSCNQVAPAWEPDSRTLLYASDCGRALGFTAICRQRVVN